MINAHLLKGRPVSLCVLDYGLFRVHAGPRVVGICGYLIRTDADECILIDSGFAAKYADDAKAATLADGLDSFGDVLICSAENLVAAQLELAGVGPNELTLMIQSHTHIEHIGGIADFPRVPIVIAEAERALPKPIYWRETQLIDWPDQAYHLITEDTVIGPGFEVFLVPGHAPGQLAMMIELPETGSVLLTSDAISRPVEIDEKFAGSWDEGLAQYHGARLMDSAAKTGAMVIFGHSPKQWPTLRKAPHAYT